MEQKTLRIIWTCSDHVQHQHRFRWAAWLCGRWQYLVHRIRQRDKNARNKSEDKSLLVDTRMAALETMAVTVLAVWDGCIAHHTFYEVRPNDMLAMLGALHAFEALATETEK